MSNYRTRLPQMEGQPFLTDGGLETTLVFHEGIDLPHFAAFPLLRDEAGARLLRRYFQTYVAIAQRFHAGLILEAATWRASPDWGALLGYSPSALAEVNRAAIRLLEEIREEAQLSQPAVISGCVGPRGDGYVPSAAMTIGEAATFHWPQIVTFAASAADMVSAITMNYTAEAIGVALAAEAARIPVAISFTVETDGRLPTGQPLGEAIQEVDEATAGYPSYFMINCAHPEHFATALGTGPWTGRIRGLRANASRLSHAELNEATELDAGDPGELGASYAGLLRGPLPNLTVFGGCCGTDHRHIESIAEACLPAPATKGI